MRRLRRWRWYTWVAVSLWAATAGAVLAALTVPLVDAFALLLGRSTTLPAHPAWPMQLAAGIAAITLAWQHYVVPYFASAEVRFKDRRTPRMMLRNFWVSLWMPFIVALIICITNFIPVYVGRHPLGRWLEIQPWILYLIFSLPALSIPPMVLMWSVRQRLMRNARNQQRCFECGYHLRGVWSSECPECGAPRFDVDLETAGNTSDAVSA